mgnify:CR=1 FL=1
MERCSSAEEVAAALMARIRSVLRRSSTVQPAAQPAAGAPAAGVRARPYALVVLVSTKREAPAAALSSSRLRVPVMLVSTKSWRV